MASSESIPIDDVILQCAGEQKVKKVTEETILYIIDVSGSTGDHFSESMTILEKEISVVEEGILKQPSQNKYYVCSFHSNSSKPSEILVDYDVKMTSIHSLRLRPEGSTQTHTAFIEANKLHSTLSQNGKGLDRVILVTDGQTNSTAANIIGEVNTLTNNNIKIDIIAVSKESVDMEIISRNEERRIPGMDIVNMIGNNINMLTIYNRRYPVIPYVGAVSSKIDKNSLMFLDTEVNLPAIIFIQNLMEKIRTVPIGWGNEKKFKLFLVDIGKYLNLLFVQFPRDEFYDNMVNAFHSSFESFQKNPEMTTERISSIIKFGFDCAKNNTAVVITNFDGRVKDGVVKKNEFAEAVNELVANGTTLKCDESICMPSGGLVVINKGVIPITCPLGKYPNSCDSKGNVFFGYDGNPQAIRIGLREFAGRVAGFPNSGGSPNVIFYIACQMSLMVIKGHPRDSTYMMKLRKLAIDQTSMEVLVSKGKYSGVGCYEQWKSGQLPAMHFSDPSKTHTSLYEDHMINPLALPETLWWALMMSMLGIFENQLCNYENAITEKGIKANENEFIAWVSKEYGSFVNGSIEYLTVEPVQTSVFTFEPFPVTEPIFLLNDHNDGRCRTRTCYSNQEIENWVKQRGCVWCNYRPTPLDFTPVTLEDPMIKYNQALGKGKRLTVTGITYKALPAAQLGATPSDATGATGTTSKNILVALVGVTGSGKSTFSAELHKRITQIGGAACHIINADKWSKKPHNLPKGKLTGAVQKDFQNFTKNSKNSTLRVVIVDICNEYGPQSNNCFGINFDKLGYTMHIAYPNMIEQQFDNYECWCLRNVLSRSISSPTTNFWLNPLEAGVVTCINVHTAKASKIRNMLAIPGKSNIITPDPSNYKNSELSKDDILPQIESGATEYAKILRPVEETVDEFMKKIGI